MPRVKALFNAVWFIVVVSIHSVSYAVSIDDYVRCSLVYGALFQAAKNAQHDGMLAYSKLRLQVVLPYVQENRDNPRAKEKLQETAIGLENEIKNIFVKQATDAIREEDPAKLKAAMPRVFQCDKAFGLSTLPLPLRAKQPPPQWNKFLEGFHAGCLEKQRKTSSPFNDAQIRKYCGCMTDNAAVKGVDSYSSEEFIDRVINESHSSCLASVR